MAGNQFKQAVPVTITFAYPSGPNNVTAVRVASSVNPFCYPPPSPALLAPLRANSASLLMQHLPMMTTSLAIQNNKAA